MTGFYFTLKEHGLKGKEQRGHFYVLGLRQKVPGICNTKLAYSCIYRYVHMHLYFLICLFGLPIGGITGPS